MTSVPKLPASYVSSTTSRWHYLAVAFFIMQALGFFGLIDHLKYGQWSGKPGDPLTQSLNTLQILVSVFLFWIGYSKSKTISLGAALLLIIAAYLFMSVLWSVDPLTSLRRSVIYFFFIVGVIGIANLLSGDEYLDLLRKIIFLSAVISLFLLAISPATVVMSDGTLCGIFPHKNFMGQVMAGGVLASLHGMRAGSGRRHSCALMLIVFIGLAFASRSATSLMIIFSFCVFEVLVAISGRYFIIILTVISILVLLIILVSPDLILDLLGKDASLTGRTELWYFVNLRIAQRPLLGWGFSAFWLTNNSAANEISANLGWVVPHAHNGLLELLLELGGIGASLFAIVFARNIWIAIRCLRTPAKELGKTLLLCCGGILLTGISEEVFVDPSHISVGMFFVMGLIGERMLRAVAQRRRFLVVAPLLRSASARGPDF